MPNFISKNRWPPNSADLNRLDYCVWNEIVTGMRWDQVVCKNTLISEACSADYEEAGSAGQLCAMVNQSWQSRRKRRCTFRKVTSLASLADTHVYVIAVLLPLLSELC